MLDRSVFYKASSLVPLHPDWGLSCRVGGGAFVLLAITSDLWINQYSKDVKEAELDNSQQHRERSRPRTNPGFNHRQ